MKTKLNQKGLAPSVGNRQSGFTIIEVLIVLAIAGLILLIVFLAVPALQRNSRNTQRRNQVAAYLGAANEFVANNNGNVPTTAANVTTINGLAADGPMTEPAAAAVPTGAQSSARDVNGPMQLVTGAKCDTAVVGNTVAGPTRAVAVRFAVENSTGGPVPQCQEG